MAQSPQRERVQWAAWWVLVILALMLLVSFWLADLWLYHGR